MAWEVCGEGGVRGGCVCRSLCLRAPHARGMWQACCWCLATPGTPAHSRLLGDSCRMHCAHVVTAYGYTCNTRVCRALPARQSFILTTRMQNVTTQPPNTTPHHQTRHRTTPTPHHTPPTPHRTSPPPHHTTLQHRTLLHNHHTCLCLCLCPRPRLPLPLPLPAPAPAPAQLHLLPPGCGGGVRDGSEERGGKGEGRVPGAAPGAPWG